MENPSPLNTKAAEHIPGWVVPQSFAARITATARTAQTDQIELSTRGSRGSQRLWKRLPMYHLGGMIEIDMAVVLYVPGRIQTRTVRRGFGGEQGAGLAPRLGVFPRRICGYLGSWGGQPKTVDCVVSKVPT